MMAVICAPVLALSLAVTPSPPASQPVELGARELQIRLVPPLGEADHAADQRFTARFTRTELTSLLKDRTDLLPLPFHFAGQQEAYLEAVDRIGMGALVERLTPFLTQEFKEGFDPQADLIVTPVPTEQRVTLDVPDLDPKQYEGPQKEVVGFLVHNVDEEGFTRIAIRAIQTTRQLLDSGSPVADRRSPTYMTLLAEQEAAALRKAKQQAAATAAAREAARKRIGKALGIYDPKTDTFKGTPNWGKESRRFTYVIHIDSASGEGKFVERLRPLVDGINAELKLAAFPTPDPLYEPGIHFDKDLKDVEILLPRPMLEDFLAQADRLERRMAEDHMISIEAVRLTDRDITNGAIASRLNLLSQGVHDVTRNRAIQRELRQFGVNSLLAVANRQLQVANLQGIADGRLPAGSNPIVLPSLTLNPLPTDRTATTIGSDFSIGADDIFFDGRQQSYGFSYIGPDGLEHRLSLDVVDSLREFWDRIERNLIVHKIKKTENLSEFTVPVGPATKTFKGIAALISQENQEIVVTGDQGALVQLSATAGSWLIIQDFAIEPIPGSSTDLTEEERRLIQDRVLLTMLLRSPQINPETKTLLVEADSLAEFESLLDQVYEAYRGQTIGEGPLTPTYEEVFEQRQREAIEDAAAEKKESNSVIKLAFYSSQGNIISTPGTTQLGDANDLTSFTTELRPNLVTPISSFFTKSAGGATGTSPLTGIRKGESSTEEKTMTHLVVRVRFPTLERERKDRDEGRHMGYFDLPLTRTPHSTVDLPFLSSSEHPLERLAKLRVGLMFDALQKERVKTPFELINPNSLLGTISLRMWETATTRLLMNRKIISNTPAAKQALLNAYRQRFNVEVRSLLEYDDAFFDAPNLALRNMTQWNNPERIIIALQNSPGRFALERLIQMIDELGEELVPIDYAEQYLGISPPNIWGRHRIYPLGDDDLKTLRRDVANHCLRFQEVYGDAFLEAVSQLLELGSYRAKDHDHLLAGPFRGGHDLVIFDHAAAALASPEKVEEAYDLFALLKRGGYQGGWFEPSLVCIEDLDKQYQKLIVRGRDILEYTNWWEFFSN